MKKGMKRKSTGSHVLNETNDKSILSAWVSHKHESFHDFRPEEAREIRQTLLTWYRASRRKLPWRGDAPPFDGSTAGAATKKRKTTKEINGKSQSTIENFFDPTSTSSKDKQGEEAKVVSASTDAEAFELTAYGVWVSEIMLQQTRVEAVIPYYIKWMKRFPTVYDLASASDEDVNAHWAGLGFYRRARLLHKGAKRVVDEYNGELPQTVAELLKIDGIGRYTASAIASIAFDVCVPVVDGNVCRVLSRLAGIANHIKAPSFKDGVAWRLAEQIVSAGNGEHAGEVNQAMMELGATFCAPSGSGVDVKDPLRSFYLSAKLGVAFAKETKWNELAYELPCTNATLSKRKKEKHDSSCRVCDPDGISIVVQSLADAFDDADGAQDLTHAATLGHQVFPMPPPKKAKREEVLAVAAISNSFLTGNGDRWLLVKRPEKGLLAGQWEFPAVCLWTSERNGSKKKVAESNISVPVIEACQREKALDSFLDELSSGNASPVLCSRKNIGSPVEHVFSHVRHTMWIEHGELTVETNCNDVVSWIAVNEREVRWMSETDMKKVGVTSGVKKILKLVKEERV